jgi:hypothetical protein
MEEHPSEAQGQKMKPDQASEPNGSKEILKNQDNPIDLSEAFGEDDALLELTDEVDAALEAEQAPLEPLDALELTEVLGETQEDDAFLELTDEVDAALGSEPAAVVSSAEKLDPVFETTAEKESVSTSNLRSDGIPAKDAPGRPTGNNMIDSLGMEIDGESKAAEADFPGSVAAFAALPAVDTPGAAPAVSQEQIQAAIETVVREMLGEKIDKILTEVIQQAVDHEISRLRTLLMDDSRQQDR